MMNICIMNMWHETWDKQTNSGLIEGTCYLECPLDFRWATEAERSS